MSDSIRESLRSMNTTPQSEQARPDQVVNNAGGFVFTVSDETRLQRFLILGTDKGTYYVKQKKLTKDNIDFIIELIKRDEELVARTVVGVSVTGSAYRNSAAIFVVAALFRYGNEKSSAIMQAVVRTSTHLFEFVEYVQLLGGWSRSTRRAVSDWYKNQPNGLAYQVIKYRQRNGWTHRDVFRMAHPVGIDKEIGNFVLGKELGEIQNPLIYGFKAAQEIGKDGLTLSDVMTEHPKLPWEAYPTSVHSDVNFWKTLFYNGQLKGQALLRNIVRFARLGAFNDMKFAHEIAIALMDDEMIKRTKLHPIQYLLALVTYQEGQIDRANSGGFSALRRKDWSVNSVIVQALNEGFYKAFKYVEPANKRTMLALDVSGSMSSPAIGIDLSCSQVCAAMAMTIMRAEPYYQVMGFSDSFRDLGINASMSLGEVVNKTSRMTFGSTDCSMPMMYALRNNIAVDTFVVMTDNETWSGTMHPFQALRTYRQKTGIDAKLVVVGLTATEFSIADPSDRGMIDVVGGDANLPALIANFSAGRI